MSDLGSDNCGLNRHDTDSSGGSRNRDGGLHGTDGIGRRRFLAVGAAAAAGLPSGLLGGAGCEVWAAESSAPPPPGGWRVAVIGHSGRGDYGHGLDTAWLSRPDCRIVAVADADRDGLAAARRRLAPARAARAAQAAGTQAAGTGAAGSETPLPGFSDYRQMLRDVPCDVVAVCPRHLDQHAEMMIAAAQAGARAIYAEKPFCRTPAEADSVLAACAASGTKVAFAHRNRYHPALPVIKRLIDEGLIGRPLEIRGRGKGDRRGGGEDLWVLGSHVLNLIHYLAGQPRSCSAVMLQDGRPVTAEDIRPGGEAVGPIGGNALHARYLFDSPLIATFDSQANDQTDHQAFGLQVIGSAGLIDIKCDCFPLAYFIPGNRWKPPTEPPMWQPITSAGVGQPEPIERLEQQVNGHTLTIDDLLGCIGTSRQPLCNLQEGAMTVEMICAVFASHQASGRAVDLPLQQREHALSVGHDTLSAGR